MGVELKTRRTPRPPPRYSMRLEHLVEAAERIGAVVEDDSAGRYRVYQVVAPAGQCWEPGLHMIRVEWPDGVRSAKQEALVDAIERVQNGVEPCLDPICPYCGDEA